MPPTIGDFFPQEYKDNHTDSLVAPGSVFRFYTDKTIPPKIKRFAILAINNDLAIVGMLYINSQINPNVFPTEELRSYHILLDAENYSFLDHDSYLDCSQIIELPIDKIKDIHAAESDSYIGRLNEENIDIAIHIVTSAKTISKKTKKRFLL
jgi:hypothetical protein